MARESQRKGFTIIEVALVLAISGLILVGAISSTSGAIARQRYNDSVQSVTDQLKRYYTQANNPQGLSDAGGNTKQALYGKFIRFANESNNSVVYSYNVIGDAEAKEAAASSDAKAIAETFKNANLTLQSGSEEAYRIPYDATIEQANKGANNHDLFTGSLLILYSPNGGVIHTYVSNGTDFNKAIDKNSSDVAKTRRLDLCINSPDIDAAGGIRRNIRIAEDGRNSTAVELIDVNAGGTGGNACNNS